MSSGPIAVLPQQTRFINIATAIVSRPAILRLAVRTGHIVVSGTVGLRLTDLVLGSTLAFELVCFGLSGMSIAQDASEVTQRRTGLKLC